MNSQQQIKPMVEGGILSAISVAMALTSIYVPLVGTVVAFIWPLPIIILVVRHGLRWGIMALLVSGSLIALLIQPLQALTMLIAFGMVGLVLGYNYRHGYGALKSLFIGMTASIVSKLAVIALSAVLLNMNPLNMQMDIMDEAFTTTLAIYQGAGMNEQQLAALADDFKQGLEMIKLLIPAVLVFAGMLDAYINFIVAGKVLRRLGHTDIAQLNRFVDWRMPQWVVYLYAFSLVGMYWGSTRELSLLFQISVNANLLANVLGFIQGLTLVVSLMERYRLSKILRSIILVLILTNGFFLQIIGFTGLFDIVFDYRRRFGGRK